MTYDPIAYWRQHDPAVMTPKRRRAYGVQRLALRRVLEPLTFTTVLDVGCGTGRVGELVRSLRPDVAYTGIDVNPRSIAAASRLLPGSELFCLPFESFHPAGRRWDLVLAIEFLMHVPPDQVADAARRLRALGRLLITCDWTPASLPEAIAPHNFAHDYRRLFGRAAATPVGEQTIFLRRGGR